MVSFIPKLPVQVSTFSPGHTCYAAHLLDGVWDLPKKSEGDPWDGNTKWIMGISVRVDELVTTRLSESVSYVKSLDRLHLMEIELFSKWC